MKMEEIKEKMNTVEVYSEDELKEYYKMYAEQTTEQNPNILIENCSELAKTLSRIIRGAYDVDNEDDRIKLLEGIADVWMSLDIILTQFNITIREGRINGTKYENEGLNKPPHFTYMVMEMLGRIIFDLSVWQRPKDVAAPANVKLDITCLKFNMNVFKHHSGITNDEIDRIISIKINHDIDRGYISPA